MNESCDRNKKSQENPDHVAPFPLMASDAAGWRDATRIIFSIQNARQRVVFSQDGAGSAAPARLAGGVSRSSGGCPEPAPAPDDEPGPLPDLFDLVAIADPSKPLWIAIENVGLPGENILLTVSVIGKLAFEADNASAPNTQRV